MREHRVTRHVAASFDDAIRAVLESIPRGQVATCGMVATALGDVRAARAVAAWVLEHPDADGGDRVVRADLRPVSKGARRSPASRLAAALPKQGLLTALREEQEHLAARVREVDDFGETRSLGGVDVAYQGDRAFAVAVRCDARSCEPVEIAKEELRADFPYIPSYLAFREFPLVERPVHHWSRPPDVLLVDGHGRLHPALFGFACFVGVRLGLPTIGVAKHPLCGTLDTARKGPDGAVPVRHLGAVRGYAWRPARGVRPVYVSVGHRISLETALSVVQGATKERYPEPLRIADRLSKEMKRETPA